MTGSLPRRLVRAVRARVRRARIRFLGAVEVRLGRRWMEETLPYPPIFVVGAPRSGSTLLYQLLTDRFDVGYLANGHARHPGAPSLVERIRGLVRGRRAELGDYRSSFGGTTGELGPSECGPFWYRFFPRRPHYTAADDFPTASRRKLRAAIGAFVDACSRPVVYKNLYNTARMEAIAAALPEALFIAIHRDLTANARSLLEGRLRVAGSYDSWWSVEPPGVERLRRLPAHEQVVEQVRALDALVARVEGSICPGRVLHLAYEDLCADPRAQLERIEAFAAAHDCDLGARGEAPASFPQRDGGSALSPELEAALLGYLERRDHVSANGVDL
jgi:sulfotransferase family protein